MNVRECMTREVMTCRPDQSLRDAARLMAECDAGILPVADGDRLVGMITDRDIAIRGVAEGKGPDATVRDCMSGEVLYCFDDENIDRVLDNMAERQIRRLPVLNRDKRLVGIVSLSDLTVRGELRHAGEALSGITRRGGDHVQSLH